MQIYSIKLPKRLSEADFETFFVKQIFEKIDKKQRRDGQVSELTLLKGNNTGHSNEYLWLVHGTVNGGAANTMIPKIEAYGAKVKNLLSYTKAASWNEQTKAM